MNNLVADLKIKGEFPFLREQEIINKYHFSNEHAYYPGSLFSWMCRREMRA
jgi:hypothetical protein